MRDSITLLFLPLPRLRTLAISGEGAGDPSCCCPPRIFSQQRARCRRRPSTPSLSLRSYRIASSALDDCWHNLLSQMPFHIAPGAHFRARKAAAQLTLMAVRPLLRILWTKRSGKAVMLPPPPEKRNPSPTQEKMRKVVKRLYLEPVGDIKVQEGTSTTRK